MRLWDVDSLVPNTWNAQEMTPEEFASLKEGIARAGFLDALTVSDNGDGTATIIGGEHRWAAAKDLGIRLIPCSTIPPGEWDEDEAQIETVRLNAVRGKPNPVKMRPLMHKFRQKYGREALPSIMGLREDKIKKYLGEKIEQTANKLPPEQRGEFEAKAREAQTKEDLDKIIREFMSTGGASLEKSFLVLSWGHKKHVYIRCSEATTKAMIRGLERVEYAGRDVNETLGPYLEMWVKSLDQVDPADVEDDPDF